MTRTRQPCRADYPCIAYIDGDVFMLDVEERDGLEAEGWAQGVEGVVWYSPGRFQPAVFTRNLDSTFIFSQIIKQLLLGKDSF